MITGDLPTYGVYARQVLGKLGIPYFIDEKHSILMNPFVEYLRAAMNVLQKNSATRAYFAICGAV